MDLFTCYEYQALTDSDQIASLSAGCMDPNVHGGSSGTWSTAACSHSDAVGGCEVDSDTDMLTLWFYPGNGNSAANVMQTCDGTFVAP